MANESSNNNRNYQYQNQNSSNNANFLKLKELGIGENDEERKEACRLHPGDIVAAIDYCLKLKRQKEQNVKLIKTKYPNLTEEKIKDLLSKNDNDLQETLKYIEFLQNSKKHEEDEKDENEEIADLFMSLLALSVVNNAANRNSLSYKIGAIKDKYPDLSEETIRKLLSRHNNDLENTLKFIEIKMKQEQERERQSAIRRRQQQQAQEQKENEVHDLFMGLLSLAIVEEAGFCTASHRNCMTIIKRLAAVKPSGGTSLRDAVIMGISHMLLVKKELVKLGALKHKFIHIVLTDGDDTTSKGSQDALKGFFLKLGNELGDLCKTYFIGVGLDYKAKRELQEISKCGGESCELFNCQDVDINDVFNRISIGLGIRHQVVAMEHQGLIFAAENKQLQLQLKENKFLVLFTLDRSGSMSGGRWEKVVSAVAAFMTGLKEHDIFGCILFNEKPEIITDS